VVGFGYKTTWLAVRNRTPGEVADALGLRDREVLDWATGTERAYIDGVYVATPVPGWTLAHGRRHVPPDFDATDPRFPDRLRALSRLLGEVQFFANERVPEYHAWALARDGQLLRAYCYVGERGEVMMFAGEPTADEVRLGIGIRDSEPARENWGDDEWEAWFATTPHEADVMAMAGCWSVDPTTIDHVAVTDPGIFGLPPWVRYP
jgi:hypothetical protein